ncbi:MAG: two-component system response regulator OmpR [Moraxellaceae bacterium]|nr:two-component system response regulator OmpR [Moraxellaceae bacterium]
MMMDTTEQIPDAASDASREQTRILVVDDDVRLRNLLQRFLEEQGYTVKAVPDAVQMDRLLARELFALLVLDLMLPGEDGMAICRRLRREGNNLPVIMLTAKGADSDRISGLEAGADDYLPKPFNPQELLARIKAVLRRQQRELPGAPSQVVEIVSFGPWRLDLSTRQLTRDNENVPLTTGEFAVLKALVQHPREPLTRDKLMNLARGREWGAMERSIDVQVSRLRRLVEDTPSKARYIQTVWGVGYVFVPDGS